MRYLGFLAIIAAIGCGSPQKAIPSAQAEPERKGPLADGKIVTTTIEDPTPRRRGVVLALLPIQNNTADRQLDPTGRALLDLLTAKLTRNSKIQLVERAKIDELTNEMARGDMGPVDPATAVRYGRMLGANILAVGSFGRVGTRHTVTMRLIKVETSEILGAENQYLPNLDDLGPEAESLADKLIAEMTRAR